MKILTRYFLILFMLLMNSFAFVAPVLANPITRQRALQNVQSFLKQRGKSIPQTSLRHAPSKSTTTVTESYYLFNIGDNAGYVIASGDDCAPAILGYADTGFVDPDSMPDNMKGWLAEYASQIKCIQEKGLSYSGNIALTATHPAISPLLTTTWGQGEPYNQNCPDFFTYGKCVTSCVATAMAQVMYYHRANSVTATTATIPAYDCSKNWTISGETLGHIHVDAIPVGSLIDWNNMLNSYKSSSTTIQQQAIANLMKYCGAAVQMNYANGWYGGSGANTNVVPIALKVYFNYSNNTKLKNRSNYSSDEEWDNLIYNELRSSRPVFYCGSNNSSAHAFVCDGYDGQGYYHINWGWSGTSDGFFLLSALDPNEQGIGGSSAGYNNNQVALINAEPSNTIPSIDNGIEFVDAMVKYFCVQKRDTNGDGGLSEEEAASVTDLGSVFQNRTITSFNELQYFTGLKTIRSNAFSGCSNLTSVTIPIGVTSIWDRAFSSCSGLSSITIPSSVTSIGERAFSSCSKLASVSVKWNEPLSIEEKVFYSSNINNAILYVPIGTKSAYKNASYWKEFNQIVEQNTSGSNITFADANVKALCVQNWDTNGDGELSESEAETVTDLGSVFKNSTITSFNELLYFTGLKTIGSYAFSDCISLSSIMIPNNVTSIGSNAFNNCNCLNSITIPDGVTSISDGVFRNCSGLTDISVNPNNTVYDSRNNCNAIIEKASNKLIAGCKKTTIPSTVTSIGSYAFSGCSGLTWITIPNGVTSIGSYAFYGCSGLTWITIPNGVTSIGSYAFWQCI